MSRAYPENYCEVLADGMSMIFTKLIELDSHNSPIVRKQILDDVQYFLYNSEKLIPLKKDKTAFLEAFKEKAAAIDTYLSKAKPN